MHTLIELARKIVDQTRGHVHHTFTDSRSFCCIVIKFTRAFTSTGIPTSPVEVFVTAKRIVRVKRKAIAHTTARNNNPPNIHVHWIIRQPACGSRRPARMRGLSTRNINLQCQFISESASRPAPWRHKTRVVLPRSETRRNSNSNVETVP